ncbi:MAG: hypothetical protein HRU70_08930 [Phycisphaeraceae bacterium]|nr:MAG: hypothetical protein HRU70_08930 [Phycisphaeraceae bacterium]
MPTLTPILAWTPFLDPIDIHRVWYLTLIPLAFGIAVVYKAVRLHDLNHYWRHVLIMTAQIALGIIALAIATWLLVILILPAIAP